MSIHYPKTYRFTLRDYAPILLLFGAIIIGDAAFAFMAPVFSPGWVLLVGVGLLVTAGLVYGLWRIHGEVEVLEDRIIYRGREGTHEIPLDAVVARADSTLGSLELHICINNAAVRIPGHPDLVQLLKDCGAFDRTPEELEKTGICPAPVERREFVIGPTQKLWSAVGGVVLAAAAGGAGSALAESSWSDMKAWPAFIGAAAFVGTVYYFLYRVFGRRVLRFEPDAVEVRRTLGILRLPYDRMTSVAFRSGSFSNLRLEIAGQGGVIRIQADDDDVDEIYALLKEHCPDAIQWPPELAEILAADGEPVPFRVETRKMTLLWYGLAVALVLTMPFLFYIEVWFGVAGVCGMVLLAAVRGFYGYCRISAYVFDHDAVRVDRGFRPRVLPRERFLNTFMQMAGDDSSLDLVFQDTIVQIRQSSIGVSMHDLADAVNRLYSEGRGGGQEED